MISMGGHYHLTRVEPAVRSLRKSGDFYGHVVVLTDFRGYTQLSETMAWDSKTVVMRGFDEDLRPTHAVKYLRGMVVKRFKTLIFKYFDADERVSSKRYALYLDTDIITTGRISRFFDDYGVFVESEYHRGPDSFISIYHDPGTSRGPHSGLMLYDRVFATGCLDRWRYLFDEVGSHMDQPLLRKTLEDPKKCIAFFLETMKTPRSHYQMATAKNLATGGNETTFIHITSFRAGRLDKGLQRRFIRSATGSLLS